MKPRVSFVVPCYKLGHLLGECLESILCQDFGNFEILVMDDCSPDSTPEVVRSVCDERVRYIRHQTNLGHLRNYNAGIAAAKGDYIWLISADDCLRSTSAVGRYVAVMDGHSEVAFAFCPAVGVENGREVGVLPWSKWADADEIIPTERVLPKLLRRNFVPAASGIVRRTCFERIGLFPTDLPFAADWYVWLMLSLCGPVAYCAEPLVQYRNHSLNMSKQLSRTARTSDNIITLWRTHLKLVKAGMARLGRCAADSLADIYTYHVVSEHFHRGPDRMTLAECQDSLLRFGTDVRVRKYISSRVHCGLADQFYARMQVTKAHEHYGRAISDDPLYVSAVVKLLLLKAGVAGHLLRRMARGANPATEIPNEA